MDCYLTLSPDLEITASEFAAAWNEDSECRSAGEAQVEETPPSTFDPGLIAGLLVGLALNVASNAVYDLIRLALKKKGVEKKIDVKQIDQPFGKQLIVVTIAEE